MEERAIRGVPWTLLTYMANKVFTVATLIVLSRLLAPSDFGVMAIAMLAILFLGYFGNFGLQSTLILRPALSMRGQGTLLTLMIGAGTSVALILVAASSAIAGAFDEPELGGVLAAMSAALVFGAPRWFYEALLQRELAFGERFWAQIASSVITAVVSIALGIAGAGVWSLAGGFLVGGLVHTAALIALSPYRVPLAFDRAEAIESVRMGKGFFLQGGLAFVEDNVDYVTVGRVLGATQLGFYSMAYRLSELPYFGIADPVSKVTFPSFAKMRHLGQDISSAFLSTLRLITLVTFPLGIILSAAAAPFTEALFGEKWLPMIGVLTVLGLWGTVRPTHATLGWLLNSVGAAGLLAGISAVTLVLLVPAVIVAASAGGAQAVAWVVFGHVLILCVVLAVFCERRTGIAVRRQWVAVRPALLAAPVGWAVTRLVSDATANWAPVLSLAASTAAAVAAFLMVVSLVEPGTVREAIRQIGRTLGQGARAAEGRAPTGQLYEAGSG